MKKNSLLFLMLASNFFALAQIKKDSIAKKLVISGYGLANYYNYNWQTDPTKRNAIDIERLVIYPGYIFNKNWRIDSEIEFEHLGTGATMDFDVQEEFGEFEQEVTKGGEVILERLYLTYNHNAKLNFRIGRIMTPMGLVTRRHRPNTYFTTTRSEVENTLIPTNWYENGIEIFGRLGKKEQIAYTVQLIEGLDATGFSSANWVKRGHQKRFEVQNAENFALMTRWDYFFDAKNALGFSYYSGNSADNRPRPDLAVPAYVNIVDFHGFLEKNGWKARALLLYGTLQNSEAVSKANRNLSNNLNVKRTPVGAASLGYFCEIGYDLLRFSKKKHVSELDIFARYDYYDSMYKVAGNIFDNPRWQREVLTAGINFMPIKDIVFKAQYSMRKLGIATDNKENTFSMGFGFEFN